MAAARLGAAQLQSSSFANIEDIQVTSIDLGLDVNFDSNVVEGSAKITAVARHSKVSNLILDTNSLVIRAVRATGADCAQQQQDLEYALAPAHKALGSALKISLPTSLSAGGSTELLVRFATSPGSTALQWLQPSQTHGGTHPYLFTQCQAIHARSFFPCQDTPAVKQAYRAVVRVPAELTALMSAVPCEDEPAVAALLDSVAEGRSTRCFSFRQDVPIPSYLFALAVGQLESRELGPRSRVWSEPGVVDAAAYEFAETSNFLAAGEELAGEYVWGRYDLLLLPPSFPYGGMENPCLTFVTPTLLAGDRSLVNVVAHEIAHSWTGNLVTNASWGDFWLNEGFTVYLERAIIGHLYGQQKQQFQAAAGYNALVETVNQIGPEHNFTRLVPDLSGGIDPDDAFSRVPYEKGFYFLYYLQELVGGPKVFGAFLKAYVQHFKFKTLTTGDFKIFFTGYFKDDARVAEVDWDAWFYAPGLPLVTNSYDTSLGQQATELAKRWHLSDVMGIGSNGPAGASAADIEGWSADQLVAFLEQLAQLRCRQPLHPRVTRAMAAAYGMDGSRNAEVRAAWYKLCITAGDEAVLPLACEFLSQQGRMKYLRPLYRALFKSRIGRDAALRTFAAARESYHPIAAKMVAADLQL